MCDCNCSDNLGIISTVGPQGVSITGYTSAATTGGQNLTFNLSNGGTMGPVFLPEGADGDNGQSVDHVQFTSSNTAPFNIPGIAGATDTYTFYADALNTISLGTFTIVNPALPVGASMSNVSTFKKVYKTGTNAPFELRTLGSTNGSITLTENTDYIDFAVAENTWVEVQPQGTLSSNNIIYLSPGVFTTVANATGYNTVAMKLDSNTNKIVMKGACIFTGAYTNGLNVTGANSQLVIPLFGISNLTYSPSIGTQAVATVQLFDVVNKHYSTAALLLSPGTAVLLLDLRFNYISSNTRISFENTMFSVSNS
jgi:hypothetical protein